MLCLMDFDGFLYLDEIDGVHMTGMGETDDR